MSRWDFGSDRRLWEAVSVQEKGRAGVDMLDYLALTSRADDGRDPADRQSQEPIMADGGERPDDCLCSGSPIERCPCFACLEAGYEEPNPDPPRSYE